MAAEVESQPPVVATPEPQPTARTTGPRASLHVLRWIAVTHSLVMLLQPVLAGIYLSGEVDALASHGINALIVTGVGAFQLFAAIPYVWKGRGPWWALNATIAVVLITEVQVGMGFGRLVAVHIPLGVSLIASQILLTVWLFRPSAAVARPRKPSRKDRGR